MRERDVAQDQSRQFLRGFPPRPDDPPRHAAHRHDRRRRALQRPVRRRALRCSRPTPSRASIGYPRAPLDDLLVFHVVFGKTVPDISLNAVANLGYADCRFLKPVYPGDTLERGLGGHRAEGKFQPQDRHRLCALARLRRDGRRGARLRALGDGAQARRGGAGAGGTRAGAAEERRAGARSARACPRSMRRPTTPCSPAARTASATTRPARRSTTSTASRSKTPSTMIATRLYQNTARIHFNHFTREQRPLRPAADLWRPRHLAGARAVVQRPRQRLPRRRDQWRPARRAAVRRADGVCLVGGAGNGGHCPAATMSARCACAPIATKDRPCADFPLKNGDDYDPAVILDLDYWVLMPR